MARQRARIRQVAEEDTNTRYFHIVAWVKKKRMFIPKLSMGDALITSRESMEAAMFDVRFLAAMCT